MLFLILWVIGFAITMKALHWIGKWFCILDDYATDFNLFVVIGFVPAVALNFVIAVSVCCYILNFSPKFFGWIFPW